MVGAIPKFLKFWRRLSCCALPTPSSNSEENSRISQKYRIEEQIPFILLLYCLFMWMIVKRSYLDDMSFNVDVDFHDPCQLSVYCRDKDKGKGKGKNKDKDKDLHDPCR